MTRRNPRRRRATAQKQLVRELNASQWSKGVIGRCEGARPAQIRSAAKILSYMPSLVRVMRAA